jgi:hypothetical protein
MSNQPRKTSNIVKRVDDVEETIPDYYGPQQSEPVGEFKKGDMYFVSDSDGRSSLPPRPRKPRRVIEQPAPRKRTKPLKKAKTIHQKVYKLHKKGRR